MEQLLKLVQKCLKHKDVTFSDSAGHKGLNEPRTLMMTK